MRWVGNSVCKVHRNLIRGGGLRYRQDRRDPSKTGKLRMVDEANPMALIMRQAGGAASNAVQDILSIRPEGLHQRVAVVLGSREEVDYVNRLHQG